MNRGLIILFLLLCFSNCKDAVLPKPKALLRLEYPEASYQTVAVGCAYSFDRNTQATVKKNNGCSVVVDYPLMKAAIYLTYRNVTGNIRGLLIDAQKLTYEHVIKAERIVPKEYINPQEKVYGMFYEVVGDAASQSQFYATDSTRHFVTGSLYFYAKPNYDSLLPAAAYLQNDMKRMIESFRWTQ